MNTPDRERMRMTLGKEILYLSRAEVAAAGLSMAEIVESVERGFGELGRGRWRCRPNRGFIPVKGRITSFTPCRPSFRPWEALG